MNGALTGGTLNASQRTAIPLHEEYTRLAYKGTPMENSSRSYRTLSVRGQTKTFGLWCTLLGANLGVALLNAAERWFAVAAVNLAGAILCAFIIRREYARLVEAAS